MAGAQTHRTASASARKARAAANERRSVSAWYATPSVAPLDRVGMGEAVHGAPVHVHLPVRSCLGHLVGERDDVGHGDVRIERSVTDKHLRGHRSRLGALRGRETAVHADHRVEGGAGARQRQRRHATEAEADRGEMPADLGAPAERAEPGGGASCQPIGSVAETHERGHDALPIARDAAPVHVAGEGHVSQLGVSMRLLSGMVVQSGPTVDDEDSGPLVTSIVVEDDDTVERRAVVPVLQVARYEGHRHLQ